MTQAHADAAHEAHKADLQSQIGDTLSEIAKALEILLFFLVLVTLRALLVLLLIAPYIMRALSVVAWVVALGKTFFAVFALYADIRPSIVGNGLTALLYAGVVMVIPAFIVIDDLAWGGYALAALVGFGIARLADQMVGQTNYYALIGVLPAALAVVGIIALASHRPARKTLKEDQHGCD